MEVLSWWSMLFCCKRYAPKESRSVMYWSIGRWIPHMDKKEQQLAIQKKQLPARSCCLSPCSATESKPLDQKVFWKESIRLAKINRLGFGKVWGSFFFSKVLYDLNIPLSFEISNFTGRHTFPFETSEKLYPWPSHLFRDFLDAWVSLVFPTVKLCQFNRTKWRIIEWYGCFQK